MGTELTAVGVLVQSGSELLKQGDSYYKQAGAKFREARITAGWKGKGKLPEVYKVELRRQGVDERTERRMLQLAANPAAEAKYKRKDAERKRTARSESDRKNSAPASDLQDKPAAAPAAEPAKHSPQVPAVQLMPGEIGEAVRGFKAASTRGKDYADPKRSLSWRTTALGHFKLLLAQSNLPQLMQMSTDEIIKLLEI